MSSHLRALIACLTLVCGIGCRGSDDSTAITVFAAASLTEAFNDAGSQLDGLEVSYRFEGSQALVAKLEQGTEADVIATADETSMQKLADAGLVEPPQVFARNSLVIAVEPGNPKSIRGLADLGRGDVAVVLADPAVPVGRYAAEALGRAGVEVSPRSLELDVKSALAKVTIGEADATIVYVTDVGEGVDGVEIPEAANVIASYPIAVVKGTDRRAAAEAFVAAAVSGPVQDALRARGFLEA